MTYTPTTREVRREYAGEPCLCGCVYDSYCSASARFDRWLEAHDREVKAQALKEAAEDFNSKYFYHSPDGGDGHYLQRHQARYVQERLRNRAQQLKWWGR